MIQLGPKARPNMVNCDHLEHSLTDARMEDNSLARTQANKGNYIVVNRCIAACNPGSGNIVPF